MSRKRSESDPEVRRKVFADLDGVLSRQCLEEKAKGPGWRRVKGNHVIRDAKGRASVKKVPAWAWSWGWQIVDEMRAERQSQPRGKRKKAS